MEKVDKEQVAAVLQEVSDLLELTGSSTFEVRAYQNAVRSIEALEGDIEDVVKSGQIAHLPGVGKVLAARITELVTTGKLDLYEKLRAEVPSGLQEMLRVPGLGPKRVRTLYESLGITTLANLQAACESGRVAALPGFGAKSQEKILKGIQFLGEHSSLFRYDVAAYDAYTIAGAVRALPQVVRIDVAGSIRRRKEVVKDVDIVASVRRDLDRDPVMDALVALPQVGSITGKGSTKTSVVLRTGMAVDLRVVLDEEYPYALHHFTGSKDHNVALRGWAHARGIKINEYGIFKNDQPIACTDEAELYRTLGMDYIEPELREDRGEIEAAREGKLPQLVTPEDLRGILHVHSTWSDGQATIREMAEATIALGKDYLGITDHSRGAAYAHGLSVEAVFRQHEEIDRLNAEYAGRFRILRGTECDILKDGSLDYDDTTLSSFDFVIASIHSHFQLAPAEQTQRLVRAMESPFCSILGHPTGRILLSREGYAPDLEAVIERAGQLGVAIELNGDPHRLDLDWRFHRFATERGVQIPITPDAHSPEGLKNIYTGVGIARKGWLTAHNVPNTLTADQLLAFFATQRKSKGAL
ncbi:MAG: DNA polymerase/3'-5' exonuclease PolX [Ktedonobacterales bacterium]